MVQVFFGLLFIVILGFLGVKVARGTVNVSVPRSAMTATLHGVEVKVGDSVAFAATNRRGNKKWRHGHFVREDSSGRVVIRMPGYYVYYVRRAASRVYPANAYAAMSNI